MKMYLIRHGEVNHNKYGIYSNEDEDLNENGINQALLLKNEIKKIDYDVIYCSSLLREKYTADIINVKNKKIIIGEQLGLMYMIYFPIL